MLDNQQYFNRFEVVQSESLFESEMDQREEFFSEKIFGSKDGHFQEMGMHW